MSLNHSAWIVFFVVIAAGMTTPEKTKGHSLRILHTNDMHSRFLQISQYGGKCTARDYKQKKCYGGFPRLLTAVKQHRRQAKEQKVPLVFLNAGDIFQGTTWYTTHKWTAASAFMNLMTIDAMSLGNHEFDDGVSGLVPFVNRSRIPIVACNIDVTNEPDLARPQLKPSVVLEVSGLKVGVMGYLTPETKVLAQTGKVEIFDEIGNLTTESTKLKKKGVDIIIALGHSGFDVDLKIAKEVPFVDVVVGGHTNTFLYTGTPPDSEIPVDVYPVMVTQSTGRKVAVVQAYAFTKYLGVLDVKFDADGEILSATGNPQLLDFSVPQNKKMVENMKPWKKSVDERTKYFLGRTKVFLDGGCRLCECNLGNLITDAFIDYGIRNHAGPGWAKAPIAIQQGGGIRSSINVLWRRGGMSMEDVITAMPFANPVEVISMKGKYLLEAFEWSVSRYDSDRKVERGEFLQYSGVKITYDLTKPPGSRIVKALARCGDCKIPYFSPIKHELTYFLLVPSFLAKGGDNYTMFPKYGRSIVTLGKMDTDIVVDFIKDRKLIYPDVQERITFVTEDPAPQTVNTSHQIGYSSYLTIICSIVIFMFK